MPSYTPEQIKEAIAYYKGISTGETRPHFDSIIYADKYGQILLAALEAAEKERDEWRESARTANTALLKVCKERDALAAYAAKLEKAGDFMHGACPIIIARDNWDVARKQNHSEDTQG